MGSFVTTNYRSEFTGDFSYADSIWITSGNDDPVEYIAFRKDAKQLSGIIDDTYRANVTSSHKLSRFLHRGGRLSRVRLTVANHVSDQHRICLLGLWLCGWTAL